MSTSGIELSGHLGQFDDGPFTYLYYSDFSSIDLDGEITVGEYPDSLELLDLGGDFVSTLAWGHNLTHIAIGMTVPGSGWLGLGLGEIGVSMTGADIIMGYVKDDGGIILEDMSAISQGKPSLDDDSYIDMAYVNGTETQETTIIEFIIPLASDDVAGKDHNWSVNETYGFFTAYHESADNLGFKHTTHTASLSVKVLPIEYDPPVKIDMTLSVRPHISQGHVTVAIQLSEETNNLDLSGIKLGIYEKSIFGKVLIDTITTDSFGFIQKDVEVEILELITIISILPANEEVKRVESQGDIELVVSTDIEEQTYGDLRDIVGERGVRAFTMFIVALPASLIIYQYLATFVKFGKISKLGKELKSKEEKIPIGESLPEDEIIPEDGRTEEETK